jgi:hypothetical protein
MQAGIGFFAPFCLISRGVVGVAPPIIPLVRTIGGALVLTIGGALVLTISVV